MKRLSGAERRRQIVEAAYAVIVEKGLADSATRDVTRKLNVGSGLLHHYFPSWRALRAEAVATFVRAEIDDVDRMLAASPANECIDRFAHWMTDDPEFCHWRLWLNALEEARRDAEMRDVVRAAYESWHQVFVRLIRRLIEETDARCADPSATAWRLSALMDGLAGIVSLGDPMPAPQEAARLFVEQFVAELYSGGRRD